MTAENIDIKTSFELPNDNDWNYLENKSINDIRIDISDFKDYKDRFLLYPRLEDCILGFNNKVGSLSVTYVLCRHYYDLGIPDEPWYISPSKDGEQSVEYLPYFTSEHYPRLFWFNHFSSSLYVEVFSIWDSFIEIVNIFYDINSRADLRQRKAIIEWLKANKEDVYKIFSELKNNPIYKKANDYRTKFVHGIGPSDISDRYSYKKDIETKMLDIDGTLSERKAVYKKVSHANVMPVGIGKYVPVREVLEAFDQFVELTALKIKELINLMINEN